MSKVKALVGAAVAIALTAPSFAFVDPSTATVRFFVSGASAPTHMLREQVVQNLCNQTLAVDVFVDGVNSLPDTDGIPVMNHTSHWAVQCVGAAGTAAAGDNLMIVKTDAGGSGNGVNPVAFVDALPGSNGLPFLNTAVAACQTAASTAYLAGDGATSYNLRVCGTAAGNFTNQIPDFGVSDVEPTIFRGTLNVPAQGDFGTPPLSWETEVGPGLVFGLAVNTIFRNELQSDQVTSGRLPGSCVAGDETAACQPDLPSWYVRSLFVGKIANWADEQVNGGTPNVPGGANGRVHLCRRVQGSGTHAQHMVHYNRTNCQSGTLSMLSQPGGSLGAPFVYENSSSGNVGLCLQALNNGTTVTGSGVTPNITTGKVSFAIGYQSLENNASGTLPYRFVKIDGVAPTVENAWNGDYTQVYFLSYNHRQNDFRTGALRPAFNAGEAAKLEAIADNGFDISGTVAGQINQGFEYSFGRSGFLVNVSDAVAPATYTAANPSVPFARLNAANAPDSCAPMYR